VEKFQIRNKKGTALVFAPERALLPLWEEAAQLKVIGIDIASARGIDILANLEKLPIASDSMDLIWCHHVLEHVQHDRLAIRELYRVLREFSGELIVSVPVEVGTSTDEYGFADPTMSGHWRMYGDDFAERLAESGLTVETRYYELSPEDCRLFCVTPEPFFLCRKTGASYKTETASGRHR